ncbi:MAG: HAD-IC family P-type ATPase [Verrucomicrobia bacterium]|nr:HAD-IC family P-type ATPase [Verrucomicrobiota bacterium]MBS0637387.1 HAD-IC family P-type ATPase [Verrucomicrobiota bacterium]
MKNKHNYPNQWHHLETAELVKLLGTDLRDGLSEPQVSKRQLEYGPNSITASPGLSLWKRFFNQFHQPLAYILIIASTITASIGEFVDSAVIFVVIFFNALVGFIQELKAEKALQALSKLVLTQAVVRRSGKKLLIPSYLLVPGDIVIIKSGDKVPADLRLFTTHNLHVDESSITGESTPSAKHTNALALDTLLADRKNLAFTGTLVTMGQAEGIVWATGDQTELGHIAWLLSETPELSTPLTKKLELFSRRILWAIFGFAVFTFSIGIMHGEATSDMFMASIALAVGAIPEGLPAAVTIVLAIGVNRLASKRAIVRKLPAVETLGSTTVICSDKTGTLTENQMTVRKVFTGLTLYDVTGSGYDPKGALCIQDIPINPQEHPQLLECLKAGVLCNDSQILYENGQYKAQGDPTEAAMLVVAQKAGILHLDTHKKTPRMDMIPFESEHMYRATLHEHTKGKVIYKVGALERLLDRCDDMLDNRGNVVPIDKASIQAASDALTTQGMRVLAITRRFSPDSTLTKEHVSHGLTFLGLEGMLDPPRQEVIHAIKRCQQAGITIKMVTGDHALTAQAVAKQIGLEGTRHQGKLNTLTGRELEKMPQELIVSKIDDTTIFARITPEQKLKLVGALQARGHIVAMTGDGVNDAPALKQANIGIAMGITGTEVAKGAADIILTDDNFATIEAAVEEGRGIFDNLTKFIAWTLPTNAGEALILVVAILLGLTLPISPVQILWINMTTAIFLGLTLAFEPKEKGLMQQPPRNPDQPILTYEVVMRTGLVSLIMLAGSFWLFFWEAEVENQILAASRTTVVNVIVLVEIGYLFNCRSLTHSAIGIGLLSNKWAVAGALAMLAAQLLFTYEPTMNKLFHSAPISLESWLRIALVATLSFLAVEFEKWCRFRLKRKKHLKFR